QYLPKTKFDDAEDLVRTANITVSSEYSFAGLPFNGIWKHLEFSMAQLLSIVPGQLPTMKIKVKAMVDTALEVELRNSQKTGNYTPDQVLEKHLIPIKKG